jgi:lipid A 3-O-deacylase
VRFKGLNMSLHTIVRNTLIVSTAVLGLQSSAFAVDSFSVEAAAGKHHTQLFRGALQWDWDKKWFDSNGTHLSGYWDLSLAMWQGNRHKGIEGNKQRFADIGFTPVFRYERSSKKGPYAEAGIGVHLFSELYDNDDRRLATAFQFGDHIGAGYVFSNGLDLGLRLQHFSNGGIKKPNGGADFAVLRLAYRF